MQLDRAELLATPQNDVRALFGVLARLRWQFGLERLLLCALRGVMASAIAVLGISVIRWLLSAPDRPLSLWFAAAGLPLLVALGVAVATWPSPRQTALAADRRLQLAERLGTALEVAHRSRPGRFDQLQVRDALDSTQSGSVGRLALANEPRREALAAVVLIALAALSLVLPTLPRPSVSAVDQAPTLPEAATGDAADRATLTEPVPLAPTDSQIATQPTERSDADLAARVQQEQAERGALDRLSNALSQVSAGQPAADAIQRGDFTTARDQLNTLADEADQLSEAAKRQLAQALQQAANATTATDRQLSDRERQASQALSRPSYSDQRQALKNLADQVQRSGARSASADQLARDVGRLQQQQGNQGQSPNGAAQSQGQAAPGPQAPSVGAGAQPAGTDGGASGSGDTAQQGGPGAGSGIDPDVLGNDATRLETAGQKVTVPTKLSSGPGVRPPDGSEDQAGADSSRANRTVSELVQAQQTGQVAPEQNLVQGDQRPIVRGYFR